MDTAFLTRSVSFAADHRILHDEVVVPLDHQHLNHAVAEFGEGRAVPTCENILRWLWPRIESRVAAPARLHSLRLHEDDRLRVDYFGGAGAAA
jgi:6-pyruvoyl-tetrahydropterin synthase